MFAKRRAAPRQKGTRQAIGAVFLLLAAAVGVYACAPEGERDHPLPTKEIGNTLHYDRTKTDSDSPRKPFGCDPRDLVNFSCD